MKLSLTAKEGRVLIDCLRCEIEMRSHEIGDSLNVKEIIQAAEELSALGGIYKRLVRRFK